MAKTSRIKYPGWLGKPLPQNWELLMLQGQDAYDRWLIAEQDKTIAALLAHYKIAGDLPPVDRWYRLVFRLALDHVPAMWPRDTRGPGRPPKLTDALLDPPAPKVRGAPVKWTDDQSLALLEWVDEIKAETAEKGKSLNDAEALREVLKEIAKSRGVTQHRAKSAFERWRYRLRVARKKFRRNSAA